MRSMTFALAPATAALLSTLLVAPPAQAASPTRVIESFTADRPIAISADDAYLWSGSTAKTGILVNGSGPTPTDGFTFQLIPPAGRALSTGRLTGIGTDSAHGVLSAGPDAATIGDADILDLRTDASGRITAFDVVYRTVPDLGASIGEVRMGQPESSIADFSMRHVEYPDVPVGAIPVDATITVTNISGRAQAVGSAASTAADFRVEHDHCSRSTLAAGASCAFDVGFSPRTAGPRVASVSLAVGGVTQRVELAGNGELGTSRLTISGQDFVDLGAPGTTHVFGEGRDNAWLGASPGGPGSYAFGLGSVGYTSDAPLVRAVFDGPSSGALAVGTHSLAPSSGPGRYAVNISAYNRGCSSQPGTETVRAFALDPYGRAGLANVSFRVTCDGDTAHPMTGSLLYHWRSDVTAPSAATAVQVSTTAPRTVTWAKSASGDVATTIVRVFPGSVAGTATTGLPAAGRSATSAVLPVLRSGQRYTVGVFSVDTSGNVSKAATSAIVG